MQCRTFIEIPGCVVRGDTMPAITYNIAVDSVPANLVGASISILFVGSGGQTIPLEVGAGITITDGINGKFQVDKIDSLQVPPGKYSGDVVITYANEERYTDVTLILNVV